MAADSSGHLVKRTQRRFLRVFLVLSAILIVVAVPLIASSSLRLDLAWRLGLAPGRDVERIAPGDAGQVLIVIPFQVPLDGGRSEFRFHAAYLMQPGDNQTQLTSLDDGAVVSVPLRTIDTIAAELNGEQLVFGARQGLHTVSYLLTVSSNTIRQLPEDQEISALPGSWQASIWDTRIGACEGISPQQQFVACFKPPSLSRYMAGDWQLDVLRYGQFKSRKEIYRGSGTRPVVGFTADDSWLYFQNENGIWREPISQGDFTET